MDNTDNQESVMNIALVKSWNYVEEYNATTGRTDERYGARLLKEGYIDGFMAGFAYKFTGRTE
jgi:hypothetical protein